MPIPVSNGLNKGNTSCLKSKKACFQRFLFILKQNRQKSELKISPLQDQFYESWEPLKTNDSFRGCSPPVMDSCPWNLRKTLPFQSKLNKLTQKFSLASKLCLIVQIQYFEISIFVDFKCQFLSINGANKCIASCLKSKKTFFQRFLFILEKNRQKKETENFTTAFLVPGVLEACEQQQQL